MKEFLIKEYKAKLAAIKSKDYVKSETLLSYYEGQLFALGRAYLHLTGHDIDEDIEEELF